MTTLNHNKNFISSSVEVLKNAYKNAKAYGIKQGYTKIYNSFHSIFTDELNKNIDLLCDNTGLQSHIFRRGQWDILYVLDDANKCVYSFMSESTYKRTAKKVGVQPHYLQATLIMQNNNTGKLKKYIATTPTVEDFLNEFNTANVGENNSIKWVYETIYGDLVEKMKQYTHFIIVYKKDKNGIVYVNLVLHNSETNKTMKMQIFHRDSDFVYEDTVNNTEDKVSIKESINTSPKVTIKDTAV